MAFTADQDRAIEITERIGSSISLLCSCSVIAMFFFVEHFQTPIHRLIFFATWGNLWSNIGMLIALSGIRRGENSALCQFQGFPSADAFWSLCMALNIYLTCFRRYDMTMLRKLEWRYFLFSYGAPFISAFIYLFIETSAKGKVYGSAFIWCWVTVEWRGLYLAVSYVPIWIANILTIGIFVWTGREIIKSRRQLHRVISDTSATEDRPDGTSRSSERRLMPTQDVRGDFACQNTSQSGKPLILLTSTYVSESERLSWIMSGTSISQAVVWPYAKRAILFFASMVITWAPCTVNRLYSYANPGHPSFALNYSQALLLPLQGFWNSCIYMSTISSPVQRFLQWKKTWRRSSV
ncbi:uncharacterized protein N7482_002041 [Penicillium canariense]|uniref:G-protein coupled receptors family 2 profile 2 domain-containing protein n=1 Tax=Penicillium canariense TaxID=189055 RepID=A0A9W9LUG8_9EURO|nr:uncharacterized protein N7482_002041 [Penicillium canariense]KAJ5176164.1 hypothetical protein N7482_002041 [Penicillium canariense]